MIITPKFSVGDKAYFIEYVLKREMVTCRACDGNGVVTLATVGGIECPVCNGKKKIVKSGRREWRLTDTMPDGGDRVRRIEIFIDPDVVDEGAEVNYAFALSYRRVPECDCFSTPEEAVAECEWRNAIISGE